MTMLTRNTTRGFSSVRQAGGREKCRAEVRVTTPQESSIDKQDSSEKQVIDHEGHYVTQERNGRGPVGPVSHVPHVLPSLFGRTAPSAASVAS